MWDLTNGKLLRTITDAHPPGTAVLHIKVGLGVQWTFLTYLCFYFMRIGPYTSLFHWSLSVATFVASVHGLKPRSFLSLSMVLSHVSFGSSSLPFPSEYSGESLNSTHMFPS